MNKGKSQAPRAYLSGAMEGAPDLGKQWRQDIKKFLVDELKHNVFDPTEQLSQILTDEELRSFREWKTNDLKNFFSVMQRIIDNDLKMLTRHSDYVVCYWDEYVSRGAGTAAEISVAYMKGIPVYFITQLSLAEVSSWAIGCAKEVFSSFGDFYLFMRKKYL